MRQSSSHTRRYITVTLKEQNSNKNLIITMTPLLFPCYFFPLSFYSFGWGVGALRLRGRRFISKSEGPRSAHIHAGESKSVEHKEPLTAQISAQRQSIPRCTRRFARSETCPHTHSNTHISSVLDLRPMKHAPVVFRVVAEKAEAAMAFQGGATSPKDRLEVPLIQLPPHPPQILAVPL